MVNQRQIGTDTRSYGDGLRAALREDPDVILIGELRDLDTIETALTAAETGHLVFGTLHTNSAADSIDRVVNVFPDGLQRQIRLQLSTCLLAVLSQQLVERKNGRGRVAACELMMVTPAIRNLIREAKTPQIASSMASAARGEHHHGQFPGAALQGSGHFRQDGEGSRRDAGLYETVCAGVTAAAGRGVRHGHI